MLTLSYSKTSPFVRKVMVTLHETGQLPDVRLVPAKVTPTGGAPDGFANPLGKVPVLMRDDGPAIHDSRVITRYLDARAGAGLYPEARIWEVLTLEALADGIMEAALLMVYETRLRDAGQRSTAWVEGQWTKVAHALDAAEARWLSHLHGPLDAGQIALGCALGYLDLRHVDRGWRTGRPGLAAWNDRFAQRDAMVATRPED